MTWSSTPRTASQPPFWTSRGESFPLWPSPWWRKTWTRRWYTNVKDWKIRHFALLHSKRPLLTLHTTAAAHHPRQVQDLLHGQQQGGHRYRHHPGQGSVPMWWVCAHEGPHQPPGARLSHGKVAVPNAFCCWAFKVHLVEWTHSTIMNICIMEHFEHSVSNLQQKCFLVKLMLLL